MICELRIYRAVPGQLPALLSRFQSHTLRLWEKDGIRQAGFWTTLIGKSSQEITSMLAWDSLAEREEALGRFSRRSRMGPCGRQDGEGWPARREHQQPVAGASRVFCREVRLWGVRRLKFPAVHSLPASASGSKSGAGSRAARLSEIRNR
jgi:hypothetical protein